MHSSDLAQFFENFANLLEIQGNEEDSFPIIAYRRAAETLRDHEGDILTLIHEGKLHTLHGIGKGIEDRARELVENGKVEDYVKLTKKIPESILDVLKVPFLGPKKAAVLFKELKVKDIPSLKKAIKSGKIEKLPGFGKKTVEKFEEGLKIMEKIQGRTLLGLSIPIVEDLLKELKKCKEIKKMEVAGSFRRREDSIGDVDILVIAKNRSKFADFVTELPEVSEVIGKGDTKISVRLESGLQVDFRMIEEDHWGASLQYFTGSKQHNIEMRSYAKEKGLKVSEYGVFETRSAGSVTRAVHDKKQIAGKTEAEVYKSLGMDLIPPELRQSSGEIDAALNHKLPDLIKLDDIRGDLHVHSTWSDGHATIEEMAKAADKLGLEYICISDHSPGLSVAGGPKTKADVLKKKKEIEEVQKKVKVKILCGTEVDIKADGSLDYSDDILKLFDIVIAAIHSGFSSDNTERLIAAIEHPLVHAIAHPTGRMIGSRKSYDLNEELLYKKAAESGTWLEINGQPTRMDLPASMVRKAKDAGCKFLIASDAHAVKEFSFLDLGVSVAKRGWLDKSDAVNAMELKKVLSARKTA